MSIKGEKARNNRGIEKTKPNTFFLPMKTASPYRWNITLSDAESEGKKSF